VCVCLSRLAGGVSDLVTESRDLIVNSSVRGVVFENNGNSHLQWCHNVVTMFHRCDLFIAGSVL
jgi:hypothetical protein